MASLSSPESCSAYHTVQGNPWPSPRPGKCRPWTLNCPDLQNAWRGHSLPRVIIVHFYSGQQRDLLLEAGQLPGGSKVSDAEHQLKSSSVTPVEDHQLRSTSQGLPVEHDLSIQQKAELSLPVPGYNTYGGPVPTHFCPEN